MSFVDGSYPHLETTSRASPTPPNSSVSCSSLCSSTVASVALGVIFIIGGAVATGLLYSHLGYVALSYLSAVLVGTALIVIARYKIEKAEQIKSLIKIEGTALTMGSNSTLLTEQKIIEAFQIIEPESTKDVRHLIIYTEPGLEWSQEVKLKEKFPELRRLILVGGGRIVFRSGQGIDLYLAKEVCWRSYNTRHQNCTWTYTETVSSIEAACIKPQSLPTLYYVDYNMK